MRRYLTSGLVLALAMGLPFPAQSADGMDAVVVTADRIEQSVKSVTRFVTVIGKDEISKGNFGTLPEMLRKQGLGIVGYGNDMTKAGVSIRGMSTNAISGFNGSYASDILILVDGRRAGTQNLGTIPLISVERVEILRGPAGVQYGGNAIGGVVNIITRRGSDNLKASLEIGGGSWKTARTEASASGKVGIVDMAAGISWMTQGGNYDTGRDEFKNTKIHNRTNYVVNMGVTPFEGHRLGVTFIGSSLDHAGDHGGYTGVANWGWTSDYNYFEQESHSVDIMYDGGYKDLGLSWKARYFHAYDKYVSAYVGTPPYECPEKMNGAQAQLSWAFRGLTLTGGFDWADSRTWSNGKDAVHAGLDNKAWFAMGKYGFMDDLVVLSAGVRYDDYDLKGESGKRDKDKATYSFGIAVNPLDWLSVKANYGTSFKMPAGLQVTGCTGGWAPYFGNPDLEPEEGKGWDVGIEAAYNGLKAGITYFRTDYRNKILASYDACLGGMKYVNVGGRSKYRGIEANASWDLGQTFGWDFMLKPYVTLTKMCTCKDEDGIRIPWVRDLEMAYGIDFVLPSVGLQIDFNMVYLGKQRETVYADDFSASWGRTGSDTTANLYVTQQLLDLGEDGKLSAKLSITNIGDAYYAPKFDYPAPGRTFYIGLKYEY